LIAKARKLYAGVSFSMEPDQRVCELDATIIDPCLSLFPGDQFRKDKGAIKLHTLLEQRWRIPTVAIVTRGTVHEVNILGQPMREAGAPISRERGS